MLKKDIFDVIVIGGGFYGSIIALSLKKRFKKVLLVEKESDLLLKASYNNQARIHNGYHYPRSFMTALRSHANYSRFISDFKEAVVDKFLMIYAIANNSKTTSNQFINFFRSIGTPLSQAPQEIRDLFNSRLIEDVFIVDEVVFNASKLRSILKKKLSSSKVKLLYKKEVIKVTSDKHITLHLKDKSTIKAKIVINCAYSGINQILVNSSLPKLPLKHEMTEMPLVKMPSKLKGMGFTIMDGPFFSVMPFPDKKLHTIHHVRYTPHDSTLNNVEDLYKNASRFLYMIKDATRYIPSLKDIEYKGSLFETKTILLSNESNDARPILFRKNYGFKNFHVILGAKIDNIYDILEEVENIT